MIGAVTKVKEIVVNNQKNTVFSCTVHGEFRVQSSRSSIHKIKCKHCRFAIKKQHKVAEEIRKIKLLGPSIHDNKFIYDNIVFDYDTNSYIVECVIHGDVRITYGNHIIRKQQCKQCSYNNKTFKSPKLYERIANSTLHNITRHGQKIHATCDIHGEIELFQNQLSSGCVKCNAITRKQNAIARITNELKSTAIGVTIVKVNQDMSVLLNCDKHGTVLCSSVTNFRRTLTCPRCGNTGMSAAECEISELIPNPVRNTKQVIPPYELDILCESGKFAIEYNGLMWHSFGYNNSEKFNNADSESSNKKKHLLKTQMCEDIGIQLFHIFENEWRDYAKQRIWRSMINNKLNRSTRIYARKCVVKEVNRSECKEFISANHIQGHIDARIRLGLYYGTRDSCELVQTMTFRTPTQTRYKGKHNYELSRMCSKLNTTVVGGASKLLKYFERNYNPEYIVSYANRRWSQNSPRNVYNILGFNYVSMTPINYFYFNQEHRELLLSRNNFQKHKLPGLLNTFDIQLTETQNMYNNGYRKIYDSGNILYIKHYKR